MVENRISNIGVDGSDGAGERMLEEVQMLDEICTEIRRRKGESTEVISLIGGAASGKTTMAEKVCQILGSADFISTDDYVVGNRQFRRENLEGRDPLLKYDEGYLNEIIDRVKRLQENQTVPVPTYDEVTGLAIAAGEENFTHHIAKVDYLVVEGDFDFVENPDVRIYLDVPDAVRLENRVARDTVQRNEADEQKVVENFQLRHELQHVPHTLPARDKADIVIEVVPEKADSGYCYKYRIK